MSTLVKVIKHRFTLVKSLEDVIYTYTQCHYPEFCHAKLSVIRLLLCWISLSWSVCVLNAITLSAILPNVVMPSVSASFWRPNYKEKAAHITLTCSSFYFFRILKSLQRILLSYIVLFNWNICCQHRASLQRDCSNHY